MQTPPQKMYPADSWILDCLHVAPSRIHGNGVFTNRPLVKGTIVIKWGGQVFTDADLKAGKAKQHSYVGIALGLYLANPTNKPLGLDDHMNHSCDGNLWMADEVSLETRLDILPGEELTADYALWLNKPDYQMKSECNCGSRFCRRIIRGLDWQRADLQKRYQAHFSPFINDLILMQNPK